MAFTPDTLSILSQPIGGEGIRFLSYKTDDNLTSVTGADYFGGAKSFGLRDYDLIVVSPKTAGFEPYIVNVDEVDSQGNVTVIVETDSASETRTGRVATKAIASTIPFADDTMLVETLGWAQPTDNGGARYRPSTSSEVASYPSRSWFQDAKGRYWLLGTVEASFLSFGVSTANTATANRDAMRAALDWARVLAAAIGSKVRLVLPAGRYPWGNGTFDNSLTSGGWYHICWVYDNVIVSGEGTLVSSTPFGSRSIGFVIRGDNVTIEGITFEDTYTLTSNFLIPVGAGSAYDTTMASGGRTYKSLTVSRCTMKNAWLSVSVQMHPGDDATTKWDGLYIKNCVSEARANASTSGNYNARTEPPGRILNVRMRGNIAKDGKTASSYNFMGVYGASVIDNESHRNMYGGCQFENGCQDCSTIGLDSFDEMTGLWVDDSRRVTASGITMRTVSETFDTPGLGMAYRGRNAVRISHQGFIDEHVDNSNYVTTDIIIMGLVGEYNKIEIGPFSTPIASSKIDRVIIDGYTFSGDGVARTGGNTAIFSTMVSDLTVANARITGPLSIGLNIGIPSGGIARLRNVKTAKVGAEVTTGLSTVGNGRLSLTDCDIHSVSYSHAGGTEAINYRLAGVKQPDIRYTSEILALADDTATSIDLPTGRNSGLLYIEQPGSAGAFGQVHIVWSGLAASAAAAGTNGATFAVNATAGTLTGTTGSDNFVTVRVNTDSKLYIENRLGAPADFRISWA